MFISRHFRLAVLIGILTFGIYMSSALLLYRVTSPPDAHFDRLAESFLHGRLFLINPPATVDLTFYHGHWYVPFPPLPALLLLPFVAVFGVAGVNTVIFGAVMGAINVVIAFLLLEALAQQCWTQLSLADNLWLTLLFGLGSVHWYVSTLGSVWFLAQICTTTFLLAAIWLAISTRKAYLAGLALALAMLGRPHVALMLPLLMAIELQHRGWGAWSDWRKWLGWGIATIAPMGLAVLFLLSYNYARFDNPLDFGYLTQNVNPSLTADLQTYGQFHSFYIPHNLWVMLLAGPVWDAERRMIVPSLEGMSILFTTPALIMLAWARQPRTLVVGAWVAVGLLLIPLMSYYNTGWWQFGYRFSLDLLPSALVLLALAAKTRVGWPMRVLILLGVVSNAWGTWWFLNPRFFEVVVFLGS
ncbi:hypothetical protein [Candidatus Oscillochloris fontis]|uniref:hypothetical protein n=1 Tax=Candidatus Oscillochloris fontis TaxID=2496868 RepID=UPI00101BADD9|nr:hypothetical protein [Candidatus Oscillochloris fontis]